MGLVSLLRGTRRVTPTIGRLATVRRDTKIEMIEYDLCMFSNSQEYADWEKMFERWLKTGASLDVFVQQVNPDAREAIARLQRVYENFGLYDFSGYPAYDVIKSNPGIRAKLLGDAKPPYKDYSLPVREDYEEVHFTLFHNPDQLWIEGSHPKGAGEAYGCEYMPVGTLRADTSIEDVRWEPFKRDVTIIRENSRKLIL